MLLMQLNLERYLNYFCQRLFLLADKARKVVTSDDTSHQQVDFDGIIRLQNIDSSILELQHSKLER